MLKHSYIGFLDELTKIASETKKVNTLPKTIAGAGGLSLAAGLSGKGLPRMLRPALLSPESGVYTTLKDVVRLKRRLAPTAAVSNTSEPLMSVAIPKGGAGPKAARPFEETQYMARGLGRKEIQAGFSRGLAYAPLSHSPEYLAHELGHLSLRDPNKTGRLLRGFIKARALGPVAGLTAGSIMAMQDPNSTTSKLAPAAVAAGFTPLLADEALASIRGLRAIRSIGNYSPRVLKSMRSGLRGAFGTYGALALGTTLPLLAFTQLRASQNKSSPTP